MRLLGGTKSGSIGLGAEIRGSRPRVGEVLGEDRVESITEQQLGTTKLGKSEPHDESELEEVVKREPVGEVQSALKDGQESEADPVGEPLRVVSLANSEESLQGIVGWDDKTSKVGEELASKVEEDQEEIQEADTADNINLGDICLLLKVYEHRIFAKLFIELRDMSLNLILESHYELM